MEWLFYHKFIGLGLLSLALDGIELLIVKLIEFQYQDKRCDFGFDWWRDELGQHCEIRAFCFRIARGKQSKVCGSKDGGAPRPDSFIRVFSSEMSACLGRSSSFADPVVCTSRI